MNDVERAALTAAYLLEYWAKKENIPNYIGLIAALKGQ